MTTSGHNTRSVRVALGDRAYDVVIGPGLLPNLVDRLRAVFGTQPRGAFLVSDANVAPAAQECFEQLTRAGVVVGTCSLEASEPRKSLGTLGVILGEMGAARIERDDPVIALGGGITGDVAGFAASVYRRGVPVVQCPTTLLAMVDASVGGKTGVNLEVEGTLQKNMVGAFHQPTLVLADIDTLATLPEREFRSGLAECLKHALLGGCVGDTEHLAWIEANLGGVMTRDPGAITELIARSVAFKAAIVAGDERETSQDLPGRPGRALLNLGHTFAHVLETLPGASPAGAPGKTPLLHGEAVGLGLIGAAVTGAAMGVSDPALADQIRALLARCGLPTRATGLPESPRLVSLMGADKKTSGGRLRLVIPQPACTARLMTPPDSASISAGWDAIRGGGVSLPGIP